MKVEIVHLVKRPENGLKQKRLICCLSWSKHSFARLLHSNSSCRLTEHEHMHSCWSGPAPIFSQHLIEHIFLCVPLLPMFNQNVILPNDYHQGFISHHLTLILQWLKKHHSWNIKFHWCFHSCNHSLTSIGLNPFHFKTRLTCIQNYGSLMSSSIHSSNH